MQKKEICIRNFQQSFNIECQVFYKRIWYEFDKDYKSAKSTDF